MTEVLLSPRELANSRLATPVPKEVALLEDFVVSAYNKIIISGNVVTRHRRPHRQGYMTSYYLNGCRLSLHALRSFFNKPMPDLTQYQVELNLLCGALRSDVAAKSLSGREQAEHLWCTEALIDNDRVLRIVDTARGNKTTYKLNGKKVRLSRLRDHFAYGPKFEEPLSGFRGLYALAATEAGSSSTLDHEELLEHLKAEQARAAKASVPLSLDGIHAAALTDNHKQAVMSVYLPFLARMAKLAAPYLTCLGIFILMGKLLH